MTPRENEILRQENETLRRRLAEAEQVNQALTSGEIDAVVDVAHQGPLLLRQAQDALRESEERYRGLFENMVEGYAHCRMVLDRGEPRDFVYLDVNRAFGQLTGLHDVVGKPVTEVLPGIRESNPELFQIYGRVALTGNPEAFETYLPSLGIWFAITAYSPKKMHFIAVFRDVTERKTADERLRDNEERYRSLFDTSVDTIITTDEDGRIVGWNRSAERMFGYAAAEVIGQPATVVVPHGYRDRHRAGLDHVKSGGEPHVIGKTVELEGLRRDGSEFPLEFSLTAWTVASGRFYTAIIRDITERKRAEEALRASEEQFRAMFDLASVGVAQANPKTGRLSRVNPKLCLITGYSAEELLTRRFSDITHPDDRERDWTLFERMVTTGSSDYQTEKRYVRKDGSIAWANVNVTVLRDATGAPTRTIAIITDITERKRTEEELLLKSAALNAAANPIVITDRDGTILWINQALSSLTGYSAREAIGKNPRALFKSGAHDQAFYRRLWDTLLAGEVWSGEITNRRKNGTLYPEKLTITPVKDARGETMHYIAIKRDLTEERHLQAQFLQSQKMEAVGRLAGGVAHDFNNLLTVIFGYSDILLQGLEPGPLHEAAQEVRRAGERAAGLTRQLLAFSRKQTLVPEVLDLGDVVSGLSTMVERLIGEDVKVSVVVSPGLGRVKADRGQLEQVVMNLAVNARDAMPKGGSLIFELQNVELDDAYTATHAEVEPGPYVLLAISDTGTGMDAETQKRIFEPFFTTKEAGKGTGLGLSTVYGIVHQSGGAIDVYSEPGRGTTFKVYLPRFAGDAAVPRGVGDPPGAGGRVRDRPRRRG